MIMKMRGCAMIMTRITDDNPISAPTSTSQRSQPSSGCALTAVTTGILFLIALFFAPYAQYIPSAATAPALIIVGAMMMAPLAEIEWSDPVVAVPAFLTLIGIPLTFSIANGLAFGLTSYALLKLLRGRATWRDGMLFVLAALFVFRFVFSRG